MENISKIIEIALKEDRAERDITTLTLIPANDRSEAFIVTKSDGIISGLTIAQAIFKRLDPQARCRFLCKDGAFVKAGNKILHIKAKTRAILSGERTALNFLTHLSGIATTTAEFVKKAGKSRAQIFDTRKTMPGLRALEKQAVKAGGGFNHRANLNEMILIKDNHRLACRKKMSLSEKILASKKSRKHVQVEVDNLGELNEALKSFPDSVLLDNMPPSTIRKAVSLTSSFSKKSNRKRPLLEVSGGVNLKNVAAIARTGVDRISVGALTHSRKSLDMSLELVEK